MSETDRFAVNVIVLAGRPPGLPCLQLLSFRRFHE